MTLNRPDKRNAMSPTLNREMIDVLETLELDADAQVLTGAGESWSAGIDLVGDVVRRAVLDLGDEQRPGWSRVLSDENVCGVSGCLGTYDARSGPVRNFVFKA